MLWAEDLAAAPQCVLTEGAGWLRLAERNEGEDEGGGCGQGDRVFRAEDPAAALQRVLT